MPQARLEREPQAWGERSPYLLASIPWPISSPASASRSTIKTVHLLAAAVADEQPTHPRLVSIKVRAPRQRIPEATPHHHFSSPHTSQRNCPGSHANFRAGPPVPHSPPLPFLTFRRSSQHPSKTTHQIPPTPKPTPKLKSTVSCSPPNSQTQKPNARVRHRKASRRLSTGHSARSGVSPAEDAKPTLCTPAATPLLCRKRERRRELAPTWHLRHAG